MSVRDHLRDCLASVRRDKQKALESGDEKAAAYAAGKESAFISAIEAVDDRSLGTDNQQRASE